MDKFSEVTIRLKDKESGAEFHFRYSFSPTTELYSYEWINSGHNDESVHFIPRLLEGIGVLREYLLKRTKLEEDGEVQEHQGRELIECLCKPPMCVKRSASLILDNTKFYCHREGKPS